MHMTPDQTRNSFSDNVTAFFGVNEKDSIASYLREIGLPQPGRYSYFPTREGGFIIPVKRYGVTIRLTHKDAADQFADKCGFTLQSLGQETFGSMNVRVLPSINANIDKKDKEHVFNLIASEGYKDNDMLPFNGGYLPLKTEKFPRGIPAYFDLDAIGLEFGADDLDNLHLAIVGAGGALSTQFAEKAQKLLFGDLQDNYTKMRSGAITPAAFWESCEDALNKGTLDNNWEKTTHKQMMILTSQTYDRDIKRLKICQKPQADTNSPPDQKPQNAGAAVIRHHMNNMF